MSAGMELLLKVVKDQASEDFISMRLNRDMFEGEEIDLYDYMALHLAEHGAIPKADTVAQELEAPFIETAHLDEPLSYYLHKLEKRTLHGEMFAGLEKCRDYLKDRDPEAALQEVSELSTRLRIVSNKRDIFDFREAADPIMAEFRKQSAMGPDYGIRLGWPTFDEMTGSLREGDTMAIVGRPSAGKTYLITWAARHAWWENHKAPLVLSMEMDALHLMQRTLGIQAHVNTKQIRNAAMTTGNLKRVKGALQAVSEHDVPFWFVDGNMVATVEDLIVLTRQLKPDVVFIDGGYLMKHPRNDISLGQRVKENVEALHAEISRGMGIPTVVSYQFNRDVTKLKKGQEAGVEHIGLSDAVGQVCSHVLGLFQKETVETFQKRRVTIMKGREGAIGEFEIRWNFQSMDFSEVPVEKKLSQMNRV